MVFKTRFVQVDNFNGLFYLVFLYQLLLYYFCYIRVKRKQALLGSNLPGTALDAGK